QREGITKKQSPRECLGYTEDNDWQRHQPGGSREFRGDLAHRRQRSFWCVHHQLAGYVEKENNYHGRGQVCEKQMIDIQARFERKWSPEPLAVLARILN